MQLDVEAIRCGSPLLAEPRRMAVEVGAATWRERGEDSARSVDCVGARVHTLQGQLNTDHTRFGGARTLIGLGQRPEIVHDSAAVRHGESECVTSLMGIEATQAR